MKWGAFGEQVRPVGPRFQVSQDTGEQTRMDVAKTQFLQGELDRAFDQQDTIDPALVEALASGDLVRVNHAIEVFLNRSSDTSSYDHELAYGLALDGRGDPTFSAGDVSESALSPSLRVEFERAVRDGQIDAAAAILKIEPLPKIRAIMRNLSVAINE